MAADRRRPAGGRCWSTSGSTSRGGKSARRGWCPTGYRLGPGLGFGKIDLSGLNWERRRCRRWAACGQSKLVDLIFAYELTRRLEARGSVVRSLAAHPSCSRTPRASRTGSCRSVPSSRGRALRWARCPTLRAVTSPDAPSGSFGGRGRFGQFRRLPRRVDSTAATKDPATAGAVWDFATELTGRVRLIETRRAATCPAALERQPRKPRDRRSPRGWRRNDRVSKIAVAAAPCQDPRSRSLPCGACFRTGLPQWCTGRRHGGASPSPRWPSVSSRWCAPTSECADPP